VYQLHVANAGTLVLTARVENGLAFGTDYTRDLVITVNAEDDGEPGEDSDTIAPTGTITLGTHTWNNFRNAITFGLFAKDTQNVAIAAEDDSDQAVTIEYYLSNSILSLADAQAFTEWTAYGGAVAIDPNNKYIIYARLTDTAGNRTIINSDGIVVYTDSAQDTAAISYTKGSGTDVDADVTLNGNTIAGVRNGAAILTAGTDYTADNNTITFKATYLESLAAADTPCTLTISYNPLGETYVDAARNAAPVSTTISLMVSPQPSAPQYVLTVIGGTGSGSYAADTAVTITANPAPSGKVFDRWTGTGGTFTDANAATTTFIMSASTATIAATYKDAPAETEPDDGTETEPGDDAEANAGGTGVVPNNNTGANTANTNTGAGTGNTNASTGTTGTETNTTTGGGTAAETTTPAAENEPPASADDPQSREIPSSETPLDTAVTQAVQTSGFPWWILIIIAAAVAVATTTILVVRRRGKAQPPA
jgi:hypothetical protein